MRSKPAVSRDPTGNDEMTFTGLRGERDIPSKAFNKLQNMTGPSEVDTSSIRPKGKTFRHMGLDGCREGRVFVCDRRVGLVDVFSCLLGRLDEMTIFINGKENHHTYYCMNDHK